MTKAFGRRPPVLRAVDLELAGPALVRIEGANGAGKSTLLRLVAGVTRPTRGDVSWTVAGRAFVPERFRATGALRAGELLAAAGADASRAPLGVAELRRRPLGALSQGQAQRVALAAALAGPASVVVLDEPFTALDAEAAGELERLLADRAREALVVLADHEARLSPGIRVRVADGTAVVAPAAGEARVRIRTGPAPVAPLPGATVDGDGWLVELSRPGAQPALAALLAAGVEVRELRPL